MTNSRTEWRGDAAAAVLALLIDGPATALQLVEHIKERSRSRWAPEPAEIYTALQLLEDEGFVRAETAEGRRTMALTDAGCTEAERRRSEQTHEPWQPPAPEPVDPREFVHSIGETAALLVQAVRAANDDQRAELDELVTTLRDDIVAVMPDLASDGGGASAGRRRTRHGGPQIPSAATADFLFGQNGLASRAVDLLQRLSAEWPDRSDPDTPA